MLKISNSKKFISILMTIIFSFSLMPSSIVWAAQNTTVPQKLLNPINGNSYAVIDESMSWSDAKAACEAMGGHLVTITNKSEQYFVSSIVGNKTKKYYWIGGFQPVGSSEPGGNWQWITGESMTYTNWHPGQPDNYKQDDEMGLIRDTDWAGAKSTGQWQDDSDINEISNSYADYGYICEWENTGTAVSIPTYNSDYPSFNGHVYHKVSKSINWLNAKNEAETLTYDGVKGHLATITSSEENRFIYSTLGSTNYYWIGGYQPPGSPEPGGNWQWVTGEQWDYTSWNGGEPNNSGNEDALAYWNDNGGWNDWGQGNSGSGYIVEFDLNVLPQPTELVDPVNGHSYAVFDNPTTWSYAKKYCESLGGHLATVTSQGEQDFLSSIVLGHNEQYYWLGGFQPNGSEEPSGNFQWVTGEPLTYTSWASGEPNNVPSVNSNIAMVAETNYWNNPEYLGKWTDDGEPCYFAQNVYGFICEWDSQGLMAHYAFNDNAKDNSGNGNDGTEYGGIQYVNGMNGKAAKFDGNDDNIIVGDPVPSSLQIQNEITLSAWIYATKYPSNDNLGLIVGSQYDTNHAGATIFLDGRTSPDGQPSLPGHIHFQIGDGSWHTTNSQTQVPLNQWVQIVATRKANEAAKIYYNGVLQPSTSVPWSGSISYNGAWFAIGQQKDLVRPFNGLIDEVSVYNRALTAAEIQAMDNVFVNDKEPPTIPEGLKVTGVTGSTLTIAWNPSADVSGVAGYKVFRDGTLVGTTTNTEYKDTGLVAGNSYSYTVKAFDKMDNISNESAAINGIPLLPSITGLDPVSGVTIGGNKVQEFKLIFADNKDSSGAVVSAEVSYDNKNWVPVQGTPSGPFTYDSTNLYYSCNVDLGPEKSGDYYIRATLTDASGFSDKKTGYYIIDRTPPTAPLGLAALHGAGTVELSWEQSKEADAVSYKLYRKTEGSSNPTLLKTISGKTNTSYIDSDVIENTKYIYYVTSVDKFDQESVPSNEISCIASSDNVLPDITGIEPGDNSTIGKHPVITVRGEDNLSLTSIKLQYSLTGADDSWQDIQELTTSGDTEGAVTCDWDASNLTGNVYVRAIAKDAVGNESNGSPVRRYTLDTTGPEKVIWKDPIANTTSIQLNWKDVSDNDFSYFEVEEKDSAVAEYKVIATVNDKLGYNVTGLISDKKYSFIVTAYDKYGNKGICSDELGVSTTTDNEPPVITNLSPASGYYSHVIHLSGTAADNVGIEGFKFQISTDKNNWKDIKSFTAAAPTSSAQFQYDLDISGMTEGSIYIRAIATDTSGLTSDATASAPYIEYSVKNTPPTAVPSDFKITNTKGLITLEWKQSIGEASYKLYKAASLEGVYSVIANGLTATGYNDTDVEQGKTYYYKISALDAAGNEGPCTEVISAVLLPDSENPKIGSFSYNEGSTLPANPDINVLATDDNRVKEVTLEYRPDGSAEDTWKSIGVSPINASSGVAAFKWYTTGLTDGLYDLKAVAKDVVGKYSEPSIIKYNLNLEAPKAPTLTVTPGGWSATLGWTSNNEADMAGYRIYRSLTSGTNYQMIKEVPTSTVSYIDTPISPGHSYYYKIEAVDIYGNSAFSNERGVSPTADDPYPPVAKAGDEKQTASGMEVQFDGTGSTDNNGIATYQWDFGDGGTAASAQPVHTYNTEGQYTVKLTVTDFAGNTASDTTKVTVLKPQESGVLQVKIIDDSTGLVIPGASVVVRFPNDTEMKYYADNNGTVKVVGEPGHVYVYGYMTDYKPNQGEGDITKNLNTSTTVKLVKGKLIDGQLTVKRMALDEIVAAGIDPYKPENQWIYKFEVHLAFTQQNPVQPIIVNGYGNGLSGLEPFTITNPGSTTTTSYVYPYVVPVPGHPEVAPTVYYLVIPGEARWLKDFFEAGLTMTNTSEEGTPFVVTDASATLNIPDGLTLMPTVYSDNKTIQIGSLNPGETKEVKWVLRGDKKGIYNLDADFSGMLQPFNDPVTANFKTQTPFRVWGDDALKMYVDAQDRADKGSPYHVRFGLKNVSDVTVYNATIELKEEVKQNYIYAPNQNLEKTIEELPAGQTMWADYWLIPSISGNLDLSKSYTLKTGTNDVSVETTITSRSEPGNYPPTVPLLEQTRNSNGTITLSWKAINGAAGYNIYSIRGDLLMSKLPEQVYQAGPSEKTVTLTETNGPKDYVITTLVPDGNGNTVEQLKHAITGFSWCGGSIVDGFSVVFKDKSGRILKSEKVVKDEAAVPPSSPTLNGYIFTGWDKNFDKVTSDMVINATYKRALDTYKVTVVHGKLSTGETTGDFQFDMPITVVAGTAPAQQKFSHWELDGQKVSTDSTYTFYVPMEDTTLKAVYVDEAGALENTPFITLLDNAIVDASNKTIVFTVTRSIPSGYSLVESGVILLKSNTALTSELTVATENAIRGEIDNNSTSQFYIRKLNVEAGDTWYGRAYLIYKDGEGNTFTVYSSNTVSRTMN